MLSYKVLAVLCVFISDVRLEDSCDSVPIISTKEVLKEDLLCEYDIRVRPVKSFHNATDVDIELTVEYLTDVFSKRSLLVTGIMGLGWNDEHLVWNPDNYDNIEEIELLSDKIWTPDLSIHNTVDFEPSLRAVASTECTVQHTGDVYCNLEARFLAQCNPDLRQWPFDKHRCTLRFGSWLHYEYELNMRPWGKPVDYSKARSWQWTLVSVDVRPKDDVDKKLNPYVRYIFNVQRFSIPITIVCFTPVVFIMCMNIYTIWTKADNKTRTYLTWINFICHLMIMRFLVAVIDGIGDTLPYILQFLEVSLVMVLLIYVETILIRFMSKTKRIMPRQLTSFCDFVLQTKAGQMFLFFELNPKRAAESSSEEDNSDLINTTMSNPEGWILLAKIIDRSTFILCILTYAIMILVFVPK